jgi:hypothetical protein
MSADLSFNGGKAEAVYAHIPGWHREGQTLRSGDTDGITSREIREAVPSLFEDRKLVPLYASMTGPLNLSDSFGLITPDSLLDMGKHRALVRPSNKRIHQVCTDGYALDGAQVGDMIDWMDALARDGELRYEAGFALAHGDRVVFTARLPSAFTVGKKDKSLAYLVVVVSFTGSIRACVTTIRAECANMTAMAISEATRNGTVEKPLAFTIPHRGTLATKLAAAQVGIAKTEQAFKRDALEAARLASKRVSKDEATAFISEMFPMVDSDGEALEGSAKTRQTVRVRVVRKAWETEKESFVRMGDTDLIGTAWHLYNAVTRAADHGATIDVPDKNGATRETAWRGLEGRKGTASERTERQFTSSLDGKLAKVKWAAKANLLALAPA